MSAGAGFFITLEGGEGAGKSTLATALCAWLREVHGAEVLHTREPGGTRLGEAVRSVVLDAGIDAVSAEAELLLYFAARAQLVREVLRPALAAGKFVLCDRFVDASHAYQGGGRGQPAARIDALAAWVVGDLAPDLTLLLDLPPADGRARVHRRGAADRLEAESVAFHGRVRDAYLARARAEPQRFCVLDAREPQERVLARARAALTPLLQQRGFA